MKIKSINNINWFENKEAYIQYLLMHDDVSKIQEALDSLDNPLTVTEAINTANELLKNNDRISSLLFNLPEEDRKQIIVNLLFSSFEKNNSFDKEVDIFIRKKAPVISWAKVDTGMIIAKFANKVYKPVNAPNYKSVNDSWDTDKLLIA